MSDYLDANNEELLKDFFSEAEQQVETLESNILVIENDGEITIVMSSVGGEQGIFRFNQSRNRQYLKNVKSEIEKI